jgi:hypothetical protein
LNFWIATGDEVQLGRIVDKPELTKIAEKYFRRSKGIPEDADLNAAGLQFPGGRFALPREFGIGHTRLLLFYNMYEIGPRSAAETLLEIPYTEIRDLLTPEFRRALAE